MDNEQLYKKALEAIKELFSDTSVNQEETVRQLEALKDEIDIMIESLEVE